MIWVTALWGVLLVLAYLGVGVWRIGRVSRGAPIDPRGGEALLLIDLQAVFWDGEAYSAADKARAQEAIHEAVAAARQVGHPVIALRQEWSIPSTKLVARLLMRGQALAGSPGTELAQAFAGAADHVLVKRVQDGFETGALDTLLHRLDVGALRIAGLDGNFCVAKTALAARARGYAVTLLRDGVLTAGPGNTARMTALMEEAGVQLA